MSPLAPRSGWLKHAALAAMLAAPLGFTSAAAAADAPTRVVDLDASGQRAGGQFEAVGTGGREVLLHQPESLTPGAPTKLVLRNLVTAKTTPVLSGPGEIQAYSDDLQRFLVSTTVSYDAADTNGKTDLYVYDRPTGRGLLATRGSDGKALGVATTARLLSGDGKVALFSVADSDTAASTYRSVVDTGAVAKVAAAKLVGDTDRTGALAVTTDGVYLGTTRTATPTAERIERLAGARPAGDGSVLVDLTGWQYTAAVRVFDTKTGVDRTIALPSWVQREYPNLIDVSPDGSKALVAISLSRGSSLGLRLVLGTVDLRTGAIAQLGNDLPWPGHRGAVVSSDWNFAGTGAVIAQLGTVPIPGSDVVIPVVPPRPATEYVQLYEGCKGYPNRFPPVPDGRPTLELSGALGLSPQVPAKAEVVVRRTTTGVITNQFTLTPGVRREINTGFGNFTITAKVTFKDGTSVTGSRSVAPYTPNGCWVGW